MKKQISSQNCDLLVGGLSQATSQAKMAVKTKKPPSKKPLDRSSNNNESLRRRKKRVCNILEEQLVKLKHDRMASTDAPHHEDRYILAISGIGAVSDSDTDFLLSEG